MNRATIEYSTQTLLSSCREGSPEAFGHLVEHLERELRNKARYLFSRESNARTLQPTALVNEAYLRLAADRRKDWKSRAHFLAAASRVMEWVLVDHARRKHALRRGADRPIVALDSLEDEVPGSQPAGLDVLSVHRALEALERLSPRQAQVARYRCFGGMSHGEIAELLGVTDRTIKSDWRLAKVFLTRELSRDLS